MSLLLRLGVAANKASFFACKIHITMWLRFYEEYDRSKHHKGGRSLIGHSNFPGKIISLVDPFAVGPALLWWSWLTCRGVSRVVSSELLAFKILPHQQRDTSGSGRGHLTTFYELVEIGHRKKCALSLWKGIQSHWHGPYLPSIWPSNTNDTRRRHTYVSVPMTFREHKKLVCYFYRPY